MRIIIVGCGRVGSALALRLNTAGHQITVIDSDREAFDRLGEGFRGRTIDGVGFDRGVLARAGIEQADALVALTSDDSSNVIIARVARKHFNVPRVVARLYDPRHAPLYEALKIPTASTVAWGVEQLEHLLTCSEPEELMSLGNGQVSIVELHVTAALAGKQVNSLNSAGEAVVVAVTRGAETHVPMRDTVLQAGDIVHLSVENRAIERVQNRWEQKGQGAL